MKNKILLIGPFPDPISGVSLANKVVLDLLDKDRNYETDIIDTSYSSFDEHVGSFSFKKFFFFLKLNLKAYKILSSDIIYMTPGQTFFGITKYTIFILLASLFRRRSIIHVHGNHIGDCYKELKGVKKSTYCFLISRFTQGIVLSKSLRNNLTPFLKDKDIYELPNFAENYLTENLKEVLPNKLQIVFLSNLMYEKGILVLLDALKILEDNNIIYEAKLAGNIDESLKEKIETKLKALKHTKYIGIVRGQEKKELLHWSNSFVLPTFYKMEGQPISILEAMATKNIIITTKHAGIPDVITNEKNGYFVNKNDVDSLSKLFKKLSNEEIKIISENNFDYFKKNFTIDIFKKKLLNILDE